MEEKTLELEKGDNYLTTTRNSINAQYTSTHGLDGQHQDVDRTVRGKVNQNDRELG